MRHNMRFFATIIVLIAILSYSNILSSDYQFYETPNQSLIWDVEIYDDEIYMLNLNSESFFISKFSFDTKSFEMEIPPAIFKERKLDDVKDMTFYNNNLYIINKNKLINVTDNFKEIILGDKYDDTSSDDLYRDLYNIIIFNDDLYIGASSKIVLSRDTLQGTPVTYEEGFSELLKLNNKGTKLERIIDERDYSESFSFNGKHVSDNQDNLWFSYMQKESLKGGLIKVNKKQDVEIIDLESYSGRNYTLRPNSLDFIEDKLFISFLPSKESNYLEGLSTYDIKNKEWNHSIDFLTKNEDRYVGRNWTVPNKTIILENGDLVLLSKEIIIKSGSDYYYYNIPKLQEEKGINYDYNRNLDLFEYKDAKFIVRANGVLEFNNSLTTSVKTELINLSVYPNPAQSEVNITYAKGLESIELVDINGRSMMSLNGLKLAYEKSISVDELSTGTYFIRINDTIYQRLVKE